MSWIDYWVDHYPVNADTEVLNEVGARVRERGHHDRQDFITGPRTVKARLTVYLTALLAKQITGEIVKSCGSRVVRRPRTLGCRAMVPG